MTLARSPLRHDLRRSASEVLEEYWDGFLPVKPAAIARKQGIKVVSEEGLSFSGMITKQDNGQVVICCNESDHSIRQRFTIAHELGHFNLGHLAGSNKMFRDYPEEYNTAAKDPLEREANDFAARLLMPAKAVDLVIEQGRAKTVEDMARLFGVSTAAMGFRLKNLGYKLG